MRKLYRIDILHIAAIVLFATGITLLIIVRVHQKRAESIEAQYPIRMWDEGGESVERDRSEWDCCDGNDIISEGGTGADIRHLIPSKD